MAGGNLGELSFDLVLRSRINDQLKTYQAELDKTAQKVGKLKDELDKANASGVEGKIKKAKSAYDEALKALKAQQTTYRGIETRMQQVLDKGHEISNVIKTITSNKGNIKVLDNNALKESGNQISRIIGLLSKVFSVGSDGKSPLISGNGFKQIIGDTKREISDLKKDVGSLSSKATQEANKSSRAVQKALDNAAKAEDKAVEYYRTRKQRVDDAISALSKRQAQYASLAEKSSADDARMLRAAGEQAEILKQRLLAAKTEYEEMQRLKAQGIPGAALSSTFLGKYTGMSELFGREARKYGSDTFRELLGGENAKADNLSYNDFISKQREVVDLARQHNAELKKQDELQDRINRKNNPLENRHIDISSEIRAKKDLNTLQEKQARNEIAIQTAIDKTAERYAALTRIIREAQAARNGTVRASERDALTAQITRINEMRHALRADINSSRGYATNLYNSGEAKIAIDNLRELTRAQEGLNKARESQYNKAVREYSNERARRESEAERIYQKTIEKTIADQQRRERVIERSFAAEQNAIDKTAERYAKLRSVFSEGLSVRNNSNSLGVEAERLTSKLRELLPMVLELRQAYNAGTYSSNMFDKGDAKVLIGDITQLTRAYRELNKEKAKEMNGKTLNDVNLKAGGFDTSVFERGLAQAKQLKEVYEQLEYLKPKLQYAWLDLETSRKSGNANTPVIRHMEDEVYRLETKVKELQVTFESLGGNTRLEKVDGEIKFLTESIERLKNVSRQTDLGKILGLHNNMPTDWFADAKKAAQAQETHLAKEREIAEAFAQEARNIERVNELLAIRAHKSQMESSKVSPYQSWSGLRNEYIREANTAVARSQEEARQIEHARELARLKEDIIRRSNQQLESLRMQTSAARDLASAFSRVHKSASDTSHVMSDIKSLFLQGGIVFAAQQFANSIIQTGGDIVQQHIALRSILGDVQEADELFQQTQQLALQSPFKFQDLNKDVKQLAAFGVESDKLYDTTKRLADVSSGLGVSFERLGLAYGQVKARSWLDGKELRQFAYAGLPMLQKIADLYNEIGKNGRRNYTTSDVRKMITKREVSFEDVDAVFKKMTDAGGQFYNMQFVLSNTLLGRWNKLMDAWSIMLGKFADDSNVIGKTFSVAIDGATSFLLQLDKMTPVLMSFGAMFAGKRMLTDLWGRFGTGKLVADMSKANLAATANFAIRQRQRVVEGEISAEKARQLVAEYKQITASAACKDQAYMQLAANGKLNNLQIARLAYTRQISGSMIGQLGTMGLLTQKQMVLARYASIHAGTMKGFLAQMRVGVSGIGTAIKGLFTWGNALFIGVGAVMSAALSYQQKASELEGKAADSTRKYAEKASSIDDTLRSVNKRISKDSVKAMEDALGKAGQLTEEVKEQVNQAGSLNEKYEILRQKMQDTLEMARQMKNDDVVKKAMMASGGDMTTDVNTSFFGKIGSWLANMGNTFGRFLGIGVGYISDNIAKMNEYENTISNISQGMSGSFNKVDAVIRKVTDSAKDSIFYRNVSKLPFEDRIQAILRSKYADKFLLELDKTDHGAYLTAKKLKKYIDGTNNVMSEMVRKNIPSIVFSLKSQFGLLTIDTKNWTQRQTQMFLLMFNNIMSAAGTASEYVRGALFKAFLASSGLQRTLNPSGLRVLTITGKGGKKLYDIYIGHEGDDKRGHYIVHGFRKNKNGGYDQLKMYDPAADKPGVKAATGSGEESHDGKSKKNGSHADKELEKFKGRVELYKKFYSDLKDAQQLYGNGAESYLKGTGLYDSVFNMGLSDVSDYTRSLRQLTSGLKGSTEERRKWLAEMKEDSGRQQLKAEEEEFKNYIGEFNRMLDGMESRYGTYKKIVKITGDKDFAKRLSVTYNGDYGAYLKSNMSPLLSERGFLNVTPDEALAMKQNDFRKKFGSENELSAIYDKYQKWKTDTNKEALDLVEELATKYQTTEQAIEAQNRLYQHQLELLKELRKNNPNITDSDERRIRTGLDKSNEERLASLRFKQFKETSNYEAIFSNLDRTSSGVIKKILAGLEGIDMKGMSPTDTKALTEAIDKATTALEERNPFAAIGDSFSRINGLQRLLDNDLLWKMNGGSIKVSDAIAKETGLKAGKTYSKVEVQGELFSNQDKLNKGIENTIKVFQSLQTALQPVIDLMSALGNKGLAEGFQIGSNALGSAANTAGAFSTLKTAAEGAGLGEGAKKVLGKAGFYGAIASAAISVGSSLINKFGFGASANKKWEKQNDYLKNMQSTLKDINGTLKNRVTGNESTATIIKSAKELDKNLNSESKEIRKTYLAWSNAHTIRNNHRNRMSTNLDYDAINEYLRSIGYTGGYVGPQEIQNLSGEQLALIKERFPTMWAKMPSEMKTYLDRIIEIESKGGDFEQNVNNVLKALTDMDFDTLHDDWRSLLDDLDSDNKAFADNFEKHMRNAILGAMITNLYKDQIDAILKEEEDYGKNDEYLDKNGNVKKHHRDKDGNYTDKDVASEYTPEEYRRIKEKNDDLSSQIRDTRDMLSDSYGWSDDSSSSTSSSIKGMSEQTADLLASYLNAIRADVSVIRQLTIPDLDSIDMTAKAQLQQLNQIAQNTFRNAEAADSINKSVTELKDMFNSSFNGVKNLSVKVK